MIKESFVFVGGKLHGKARKLQALELSFPHRWVVPVLDDVTIKDEKYISMELSPELSQGKHEKPTYIYRHCEVNEEQALELWRLI